MLAKFYTDFPYNEKKRSIFHAPPAIKPFYAPAKQRPDVTGSNEKQASFVPFIHAVRGIAPLVVMWSHLVGLWIYQSSITWEPWVAFYNYAMLPFHIYQGGGHLGVVLFFLISGYVISHVSTRESRFEFAIKRIFRILPPLFIAVFAVYISNTLLSERGLPLLPGTHSTQIGDYVLTATLMDRFIYATSFSLSVTWTLVAEFWFYGFVLLIIPAMKNHPIKATFILLGMFSALASPAITVSYFSANFENTVYIPIFIIGRIFFLMDQKKITPEQTWILASSSALLFFATHEARFPNQLLQGPIIKAYTYPAAIIIFAGLRSMELRSVPKLLMFFGDISYSMYLLHLPVGLTIITMLSDKISYGLSLMLAVTVTIAMSWISYHLIEKPSQKAARKVCALAGRRPKSEQQSLRGNS